MRWEGGRRSGNVEDRRGMPMRGGLVGGGIGTIVIVLIVSWIFGIDPSMLLQNVPVDSTSGPEQPAPPPPAPGEDPQADFVTTMLGYTEDTWAEIFQSAGKTYEPPRLVLFTEATQSACGLGQAAMGPFYCPEDRKVYLDLSFFRELAQRFGAPGDFAQAYVIAHEVGHHVQNLLGVSEKVRAMRGEMDEARSNALSVRVELQADCYAGVWAQRTDQARSIIEQGDVEEGLTAATAIGDDRLQKETRGYVTPDSFTHGSSEQRARWFRRGLEKGDPADCDTFGASDL